MEHYPTKEAAIVLLLLGLVFLAGGGCGVFAFWNTHHFTISALKYNGRDATVLCAIFGYLVWGSVALYASVKLFRRAEYT